MKKAKDDTAQALRSLVKKTDVNRQEYLERLIHITVAMEDHIRADAIAFEALGKQLIEVNNDVKSLLASRSFLRGTWFAIVIACTFVAAVAGLIVAWYK